MQRFNWLGLGFLAPAIVVVVLFFLAPVILTVFFAFTNMSTSTGVTGGEYLLSQTSVRKLADGQVGQGTLDKLKNAGYRVDEKGLAAFSERFGAEMAAELSDKTSGREFRLAPRYGTRVEEPAKAHPLHPRA